jgi:hypothetical protein
VTTAANLTHDALANPLRRDAAGWLSADIESRALDQTAGVIEDTRRYLFGLPVDLDGPDNAVRYHEVARALSVAEGHDIADPVYPDWDANEAAFARWAETPHESVEDDQLDGALQNGERHHGYLISVSRG